MFRRITLAVALLALVALGCGKKDRLVGTWEMVKEGGAIGGPGKLTFDGNGGMKTESTAMGVRSTTTGTYKLEGDQLTLTGTRNDVEPVNPKDAGDPSFKSTLDAAKMIGEAGLNKPNTISVTWSSDDEFSMNANGLSQGFKRVH